MLDRALAIVRMKPLDPGVMRFDRRLRREPVQVQIFRRAAPGEAVAHVDAHAADAADLLNALKIELALTEPLEDGLALSRVAEGDADPLAERKGADLVIAIRPALRIGLEHLLFAVDHHFAVAPLEFCADRGRRHLPDRPADHVLALEVENLLRRPVEG